MFFGFPNGLISVRTHDFHYSFTEVTAMARLARAEVFDPSPTSPTSFSIIFLRCGRMGLRDVLVLDASFRLWKTRKSNVVRIRVVFEPLFFAVRPCTIINYRIAVLAGWIS